MKAVSWHLENKKGPIAVARCVGQALAGSSKPLIEMVTPRDGRDVGLRDCFTGAMCRILVIGLAAPLMALATAPSVTITPASRSITASHSTTFTATATGTAPLVYEWQIQLDGFNWVPIDNFIWSAGTADTNILSLPNVPTVLNAIGTAYVRCLVSNASGYVLSSSSSLTVTATSGATLCVDRDPGGRYNFSYFSGLSPVFHLSALSGATPAQVSFTLIYEGGTGLGNTVAWSVSTDGGVTWTTISNGSQYNISSEGMTLYLPSPQSTDNGHLFRAVVTDSSSSSTVTTNPARLDVGDPIVTSDISTGDGTNNGSQTAHYSGVGTTVTFHVHAVGNTTLSYQWRISTYPGSTWANAPGASTSSTYSVLVNNVSQNENIYECVVTDTNGSTTSNPMLLTAIP